MTGKTVSPPEARHRPQIGHRLNGQGAPETFPAELHIVTESWNRVVVPYLVYMPETGRLLMLVACDYPHRPFILWSDDGGETWIQPRPVEKESDDPSHHIGVSLTYLGEGNVILSIESSGRYFRRDFGETWSDPVPKPPMSDGSPWYQWDPYLVDGDPATGKVLRLWETGWKFDNSAAESGMGLCPQRPFLRYREDKGQTWSKEVEVARGVGGGEVALFRAGNGNMIAACRTGVPTRFNQPIPEIDHYEGLGIAISKDNGQTWSELNVLYEYGRHQGQPGNQRQPVDVHGPVARRPEPDRLRQGFPKPGSQDLQHGGRPGQMAGERPTRECRSNHCRRAL